MFCPYFEAILLFLQIENPRTDTELQADLLPKVCSLVDAMQANCMQLCQPVPVSHLMNRSSKQMVALHAFKY